ncbi:Leukocyte receptor cluster member 9 [Holothuria leucospilota]|uniref:Leukocyte receptor cluster member 9 n=1 Tax=Holothuria leucospilota TaxID=206669 RepID=A0A9Q1C4G4_HOLLE|nr:Leukocyte receptor cluster member 9 [Holothuria leucospilota]
MAGSVMEVESGLPARSFMSEEIQGEIDILKSIYSSENEVIIQKEGSTENKENGLSASSEVIIKVSPDSCPCTVIVTLSGDYPSKPPMRIEITEKNPEKTRLSVDSLQAILQTLYQTAQDNVGSPMVFTLVEKFKELVEQESSSSSSGEETQQLEFADERVTSTPDTDLVDDVKPKKKIKAKKKKSDVVDTSLINTKKPPMKTATDVLHRIMWDDCLDEKNFVVGYLDRFLGVLEQPFTAFDWGDLAEADDITVLAIPRHRIQYFKYKDVIVWDKTQRLDLVFGSTGSGMTIKDVLKKFEKEDANFEEKEVCESNLTDDEGGMDTGECEDDFERLQTSEEDEKCVKTGKSRRATHFVSVRITAKDVIENVQKFQRTISEGDEILQKACIVPEKLHITLCVMRFEDPKEIERTLNVLKELHRDLALCFAPVTILHFKKVECWQGRVVVCPLEGPEKERLKRAADLICDKLKEEGIDVSDGHKQFNPHLTSLKIKPAIRKKDKKYKIKQELVSPHQETDVGCQDVDEIHLCSMTDRPRADGFYHTLATISMNLD